MSIYLAILFSLIMGVSGAFLVKKNGIKIGLADLPTKRSSHSLIVPKGGGVGFVLGCLVVGVTFKISCFLIIPAFIISLVSFAGDIKDIKPKIRLILQFISAFVFLLSLVFYEISLINILIVIFSSVFIVGTSNFYNFMDGIDGIAGITGVVCFFLLSLYAYLNGLDSGIFILCLCVTSGCTGFLFLNFPKAKVFMGDVGSVFLGFLFACMAVRFSDTFYDFFCISGFLYLFYIDEITTMYIRLKNNESFFEPHRRHLYQILANEHKISHWKISLCFGIFQLVLGLAIIKLKTFGLIYILSLYVFILILFISISLYFRKKALKNSF